MVKLLRNTYLLFWVAFIATFPLIASQASVLYPTHFEKIALPYEANTVECTFKDSQGMIWLGTRRGLFTYDGYNVRKQLDGNIHAIAEGGENSLCIGSDNGIFWYDIKSLRIIFPYKSIPKVGDVRVLENIGKRLFVGTKSEGVFCLNRTNGKWSNYKLASNDNDIVFAFEQVGKDIYIAHYSGLSRISHSGAIYDEGVNDNVYALWYDKARSSLWIGTEHGLICKDMKNGFAKEVITGTTINQIEPSPTGEIHLSSEYGLTIFNPSDRSTKTICHYANAFNKGLPSNTIHQIKFYGDELWITTDRGVAFAQSSPIFNTEDLQSLSKSSAGNVISSVYVDSDHGMWFGGDNGVLHVTKNSSKWFKVGTGLKKSKVRKIFEDRDNDIWIATDASIARYDKAHDKFSYYTLTDPLGRNANWAYDIYEDKHGRLWVATYMSGLFVVDKKKLLTSNGFVKTGVSPFSAFEDITSAIYQFIPDASGLLWANTIKGLACINTNTMSVSLKKEMYIDNMVLHGHVLWIDVQGKLYRYDIRKNKLEDTKFQLGEGMIHSFVKENQRIWMSTSAGLFYIDNPSGEINPYKSLGQPFTAGMYLKEKGEILWGGEDFVCHQFLPEEIRQQDNSKVYITNITENSETINGLNPRFCPVITLNTGNDILIELATFDYDNKSTETFFYKIGEDGEWHALPSGTNRIALAHMASGTHQLIVTTDPEYHERNLSVYKLTVPYPWYLRWWALTSYVMMLAAIVYILSSLYKRRQMAKFYQRERERVMALTQQKIDFFVDMSHELKTPLSLITAPLDRLIDDAANAKLRDGLRTIRANAAKLNSLIRRIMDLKQLEIEGESRLLSTRIDLVALIKGCADEFSDISRERQVTIDVQSSHATILMYADSVKMQMIMRNILSNAMRFVPDKSGKIDIRVSKASEKISIDVVDNGPGVKHSELSKLFDRHFVGSNTTTGSGIGLSIVKKYVELHGGNVKARNEGGIAINH
ncbi:MAG: hybrid sensor histidine kinase/response regulator [Prevotella sp.]|nr:hybrid sensor histidine kinase/response regulator [Prevotella sp.]